MIEGESLDFPAVNLSKKSRKALSLIKLWSPTGNSGLSTAGQILLEDLFDKVEVVPASADRDYSIIKL